MLNFHLSDNDSKTRIVSISSLASDWKTYTILANTFVGVMIFIGLWIAIDLESTLITQKSGFWGWLLEIFGYTGFQTALTTINLFKILCIICVVVFIISITLDVYAYVRKDSFAEETLKILP